MEDAPEPERVEAVAAELGGSNGVEALCAAARAFAHTGQPERAAGPIRRAIALLELGDGLLDMEGYRGEALVEIATAEAAAGMLDEAREHFDQAATLAYSNNRLREALSVGLAQAGQLDRALEMIRAVEFLTANGTTDALAALAPHFAHAGRIDDLCGAVVQLGVTSAVVRAVCERLTSEGHVDAALAIWRTGLDKAGAGRGADVFDVLAAGATTLAELDSGDTLWAMCEAAFDVDNWWANSAT